MSAGGPAPVTALPRIVFVTGTDTGVGKTVVTAALAAALSARGRSVAVYKPTQAGLENGAGDIDLVRALAGIDDVHEGIRLRHAMAPVAAAEREAVALPAADAHLATIQRLASGHDHTLVEGAGGVLVQLDSARRTLADIAAAAGPGVRRVRRSDRRLPRRARHPQPHRTDHRGAHPARRARSRPGSRRLAARADRRSTSATTAT